MTALRQPRSEVLCFLVVLVCLFISNCGAAEAQVSLSDRIAGREFSYIVQQGGSLTAIGARFGVGAAALAATNGLSSSARLKVGQQLRVNNRHIVPPITVDRMVINIPQRMLFYLPKNGALRHYPVGLGKPDWPTPTGGFTVAVKEENPVWDVPLSIQEEMRRDGKAVQTCVPPGPDNPLGKHWLGLSIGGYGIHGTIAPASIFQFQTHGCIRLHSDDIAELFNDVPRGTAGTLIYQRLLLARVGDRIFLEVHRDSYHRQPNILEAFAQTIKLENLDAKVDWQLAEAIMQKQAGIARDITKGIRAPVTDTAQTAPPKTSERNR